MWGPSLVTPRHLGGAAALWAAAQVESAPGPSGLCKHQETTSLFLLPLVAGMKACFVSCELPDGQDKSRGQLSTPSHCSIPFLLAGDDSINLSLKETFETATWV